MTLVTVLYAICIISAVAFFASRARALSSVSGDQRKLHSLPQYYGTNGLLLSLIPALILLLIWTYLQSLFIENHVAGLIPSELITENANINLLMSEVERLSDGLKMVVSTGLMSRDALSATINDLTVIEAALKQADVFLSGDIRPEIMSAAQTRYVLETDGNQYRNWVVILVSIIGFATAFLQAKQDFRTYRFVDPCVRCDTGDFHKCWDRSVNGV